jgi:cob(I)alamin adenosyltransferase
MDNVTFLANNSDNSTHLIGYFLKLVVKAMAPRPKDVLLYNLVCLSESLLERSFMDRGLVLINTGSGKGKTTAALGVVVRALGHGLKVAFIQFIKSQDTGESRFLEEMAALKPGQVFYSRRGKGFVGRNPSQTDRELALEGLELALTLADQYDLLVLDEINVAMSLGLLDSTTVADLVKNRPPKVNFILTGRGCPDNIITLADTVTEMQDVKHAFRAGISARSGLDY